MPKFTTGTTVKSNRTIYGPGISEGRTYKVIDVADTADSVRITNDRGTTRWVNAAYFTPVAPPALKPVEAKKHWLIAVLVDGEPKPAPSPRTYDTEKQAHAVARSMAEKIPGQTFVVYEATGFTHVPAKPITEVYAL